MTDFSNPVERQKEWHSYYTEKRIVHQWLQVNLLERLPVQHILEIGPYLGVVTAMLASAGYKVTTLDIENRPLCVGADRHIQADVANIDPATLPAADAIICCETLEHVVWPKVGGVLQKLSDSKIPWLILSVPYEGAQFGLSLYLNRFMARRRSMIRNFRFLKNFKTEDMDTWRTHKWEIGYRDYPVQRLRDELSQNGWEPVRQEFTSGCRSIFLVCRNRQAAA